MGVIRVLDTAVADQIAAGEVVERPASVVKELLENSLDAGARRIEVVVDGGGLERIRVLDDGGGMEPDDAVLCFSRHATSKLDTLDDLRRITSFGFRGEALAAIASVSKVTLRSKPRDRIAAATVRVDGGRVAHVGETGGPTGTAIDVEDLFFNVPARRKFLKAPRTEAGHVEDAICATALARPDVSFALHVDGKLALDAPAAPANAGLEHAQRVERAVLCLGKQVRPFLFPFERRTDLLSLTGYIVAPLETKRDMSGVQLTVNRRPVTDRALSQAVRTAFRTLLEVGRMPIVALDVGIDPELVDINVHPRKAEVRFADPRRVTGHIIALLSEFLAETPWLKSRSTSVPPRVMQLAARDGSAVPSVPASAPMSAPMSAPIGLDVLDTHRARIADALARFDERVESAVVTRAVAAVAHEPHTVRLPLAGVGEAGNFSSLRVVGQVKGTFLVLESPDGMVVIDQHAAHERVVFEKLKAARANGHAPAQPLLVPLIIELSLLEVGAIEDEDGRAALERHGLVIDAFGPRQGAIKSVPGGLDAKKAEQIARDALREIADRSTGSLDERDDKVCARLACHAAVRAGDAMSGESIRALLRELDAIDLGAHCPHGRPVVRLIPYEDMAAWFDRD